MGNVNDTSLVDVVPDTLTQAKENTLWLWCKERDNGQHAGGHAKEGKDCNLCDTLGVVKAHSLGDCVDELKSGALDDTVGDEEAKALHDHCLIRF